MEGLVEGKGVLVGEMGAFVGLGVGVKGDGV